MGVNSLPKTVTPQHRDCDLNPGLSAPESSTLTTRLPSHHLSSSASLSLQTFIDEHNAALSLNGISISPAVFAGLQGRIYGVARVTSRPPPTGVAAYFMLLLCV